MESSKSVTYGSSKLVPSVKELTKQPMIAPPPRYVRSDIDPPIISTSALASTVPVIDMQKLLGGDDMELELEKLHLACKDWGFFQLVNHGVEPMLLERVKHEIQEFFELPPEEKKRFWQREGDLEGFGQQFVTSDEQKLEWGDTFTLTTFPINARKPHLFPKLPLPFRDTLEVFSAELKNLAMRILGMMERVLKTEVKEITDIFKDGTQAMRMNYYPPCPQPEKVIGLMPHSDAIGLTILLQINEMEGLQIKKEESWIPIKPLPDAFVINIADMLEIVTNGIYRSIEHRATVNKVKERLSVAAFYSPNFEAEIGPVKSLVRPHTQALFKRITVTDYLKGFFARELNGKSYLDTMRIEN